MFALKKGHKKTQKNDTTKKYASGESLKTRNEIIEIWAQRPNKLKNTQVDDKTYYNIIHLKT